VAGLFTLASVPTGKGSFRGEIMSKFVKNAFRKASPVSTEDVFNQLFDSNVQLGQPSPETRVSEYLSSTSDFALIGAAAGSAPDKHIAEATNEATVTDKPIRAGSGTISLTAAGVAVTENFNTLSNVAGSTTNATLPTGWFTTETGGGARDNEQYAVDTGSSNTGDTYSYGAPGSTDRALGGLQTGTLIPVIGASFTNTTGQTLTSLLVAFTGEQWRISNSLAARFDRLDFQISFDATSLTTGTWTDVNALDFTGPIGTAASVGALDGNAAANRTAISATISSADIPGFSIANGATFWIRFNDLNASGADDGLAIDDFSLTGIAAAPSPGTLAINDVTVAEGNSGTTNYTFTVTRSGGSAGTVSATWTLANGTSDDADFTTTPQTGTVSFADGETSQTITITVAGDTAVEGNETFFVNLTAPTGGATITDGQGQGTITNDDTPPVGTLAIGDATIVEGDAGTTNIVFTVTRTGGSSGAVGASWSFTHTNTSNDDFSPFVSSGTVAFADGETTATITLAVAGDTVVEGNEEFQITLFNPTGGATITDNSGIGTITNDDVAPIANVWINEIHYDNAGADANEFVEVAGLAGVDLTGWSIVLYNGNGGASYSTINLSGTLTDSSNGFGFFKALAPGAQNGAPDGIALVDNLGRVVQFLSYEGTMTATNGPANGLTSTDIGVSQDNATVGLTLQLTGTGSSYADFTWAANVANTEAAVNAGQTFLSGTDQGQISIRDASVIEGNSGTSTISFTVSRAGGFSSAATVDYTVNLTGTADAADFGGAAVFSGTLNFAVGEFTRTITLPVQGDTTGEGNETFTVALSNVTGNAVIADGNANGTILNDDPVALTIMQIQGEAHQSVYVGQPVSTNGIVTAVAANGFYLQDASGDANARTSDAIFIFTSSAPTVVVGDGVTVSGTVAEFTGAAGALSLTQITSPLVTVNSSGNALPTALLIGTGGIVPPSEWIDDDGLTTYDPLTDGIDFWESLEGMRVTLDTPQVVANTNSFGETYTVVSGGAGASGVNSSGGITISPNGSSGQTDGDFNPEMIQIDDNSTIFAGFTPNYTTGDRLSNVTGIVNYAFGTYEVLVTQAVTVTNDVTLARETTTLTGSATGLTMATYNVENLDPGDTPRFSLLATDIVTALQAPDIIGLQEIQDADGAGTGSDLSGAATAQLLINAIIAAGGPTYTYIEVAPTVANTTGGEPNGNIRNGFLYNASRVNYITGSLTQISDSAFANSRSPLVASFSFNGQVVTAVNVHFTSRGGSEDLWGSSQPPANAGEGARTAQIAAVNAYVNNHLATNPAYDVVLMGDFNGFYFEDEQQQLAGTLVNVGVANLPEAELYSYLFEGNSQLLDNIYASSRLISGSAYDAVHINALFNEATRPTDHDPQLARFAIAAGITSFGDGDANNLMGTPGEDSLFGLGSDDVIDGLASNDRISGGAGADQLFGGEGNDTLYIDTSDTVIDGGAGTDTIYFAGSGALAGSVVSIEAVQLVSGANMILTGTQFAGLAVDTAVSGNGMLTINIDTPFTTTFTTLYSFSGNVTVTMNGTTGIDAMKAGNVSHTINGGDGVDQITGGSAVDTINGGDGNDKIMGRGGADILTGGTGNDQFRYATAAESGLGAAADRITDFVIGEDILVFTLIDADVVTPGDQPFGFIGTAAFTNTGIGQIRYQDSGANLLVQADVDGDGNADMEIILQGLAGQTLTSGNINLGAVSDPLPTKFDVMKVLDSVKPVGSVTELPSSLASPEFESMQSGVFAESSIDEIQGLVRYYEKNNVLMEPLLVI
jgi:predicted extracellular nuclease